jgi:hypothetical protein
VRGAPSSDELRLIGRQECIRSVIHQIGRTGSLAPNHCLTIALQAWLEAAPWLPPPPPALCGFSAPSA